MSGNFITFACFKPVMGITFSRKETLMESNETKETYYSVGAYARADGAKLGLMWIVSFALFVGSFHYPICGTLWMSTMIFTPFYVAILCRRYADKMKGKASYWKCYSHSVLTVFYASLFLAVAQWVYFQYFDHGLIIEKYAGMLSDKEFVGKLESVGYPKNVATDFAIALRKMRPIDIAIQCLWSNMLAGLIMGLTSALYASMRRQWK